MFRDSFTLDKVDQDLWILRIHNKVDFAWEVVWAHSWQNPQKDDFQYMVDLTLNYLKDGLDCVKDWSSDSGLHESLQHLGPVNMAQTIQVIPNIILGRCSDPFNRLLLDQLFTRQDEFKETEICTNVGALWSALKTKNLTVAQPRVMSATAPISLYVTLKRDYSSMIKTLEAYAPD